MRIESKVRCRVLQIAPVDPANKRSTAVKSSCFSSQSKDAMFCPCVKPGAEEEESERGRDAGPYAADTITTTDTAMDKVQSKEVIVVEQPGKQNSHGEEAGGGMNNNPATSNKDQGEAANSGSKPKQEDDGETTSPEDTANSTSISSARIDDETAAALRSMISKFASTSVTGLDPMPTPPVSLRGKLALLQDRTDVFEKASTACSSYIRALFRHNDSDVETEYGATFCDDDLLGGEHVVVVNEDGSVALRCFHVEPRDKDVIAVSYQWSAITGTEFEWQGGEVKCTTCRFAGGNRKRGGLNPTILGPGTYWVDHLCCEPMPKGLWSIYKSFYLYNTNERLVITTASALANNCVHLCNLIADLEQDKFLDVSRPDVARAITEKLRMTTEHESRGWLVWEEVAASASHVLIIIDDDTADSSDSQVAVMYSNKARTSDKVLVRPMDSLEAIRPLIGTSAEAKVAKVLAACLLTAGEPSNSDDEDQNDGWTCLVQTSNDIPWPVLLALTNIVQGILRAGHMFDVYDICKASSIFGLQQEIIVTLLDNTPTYNYLDGEEHDAFPISEHSWLPPLMVLAGTGDGGDGVEESMPCILLQFPGAPPTHWPLEKLLRVMDGAHPLLTVARIRGLLCSHKMDVSALRCKPFVETVGVAPDGLLLHIAFFVELIQGAHMLLPVKLVWELEALDSEGCGKCLKVCTEQWEPLHHAVFPPMPGMPSLCGVMAKRVVPPDREKYVLGYVEESWLTHNKDDHGSSIIREQWPIAHKWCQDNGVPNEMYTCTPMVA